VGGLTQAQIDEVESLASRIANAVAVRRIGTPLDVRESVSKVKTLCRVVPDPAGA